MRFDWAAFWSRASLAEPRPLSLAQGDAIRLQALRQVRSLAPVLIAGTLLDILTLDAIFWSNHSSAFLAMWTLTSFTVVAFWLAIGRRSRAAEPRWTPVTHVRVLAIGMMSISFAWTIPMVAFFADASEAQRVVLVASATGILAGGAIALAPVWQAALLFQAPIVTSGVFVLIQRSEPLYYLLMGLVAVFMGKIYYMVRERGRLMVENYLTAETLREQGQVISLLLKEFEEGSSDWLFETDRAGALTRCGDRLAKLLGCEADEVTGFAVIQLVDESMPEGRAAKQALIEAGLKLTPLRDLLVPVLLRGERLWWRVTANAVRDAQGRFCGYRGVGSDVTAARRAEASIERMARFDALTGLANRVELQARLRDALQVGGEVAVISVDLDRFKSVNDTLGHHIGDGLLQKVAARLSAMMGPRDVAARLGGDEFVVLRQCEPGRRHERAALGVFADRIIRTLAESYEIDGYRVLVGASVGVALPGPEGVDEDELLRNSDLALYRAKAEGKGRYRFFESEMDAALQGRRTLEIELRDALQRDELTVHFQPLVDIETSIVVGCEALARWTHPTRGPISPVDFIPVAEDTGLIIPLGEYVLRAACREAASWPHERLIAVNLSVVQFRFAGLVEQVRRVLRETGLPAHRLELEITESILIEDKEATMAILTELRALGVRIALDDFGTGYSSLAYLSSFPFDKIKIDRSFVRDVESRPDAAAIIRAIVSIASTLGMGATAEGVETECELEWLRRHGCDEAQGFLFGRPVPAQGLGAIIAEDQRASARAPRRAA
jgi:diguanylate cyclase (GGDEF)-like protein/PAS domain S-box-containing protein